MGLCASFGGCRPNGRGQLVKENAALPAYIAVTAAYWGFMMTDGALRMLVLLHFHGLGFSPVQLAYLFVLYEIAGVVTNLSAGWIAARFGLTATLFAGLALQIVALLALTRLDPAWAVTASVIFVMIVQGASGVAKDLSKMSAKSAVKLLAPTHEGGLFRWVAFLTGSKNAVKGFGFLLGASLLAVSSFATALYAMASLLAIIFAALILKLPKRLPAGRKDAKFREVFSKNANINWLSFARMFLFGARDVWFVVGIPIYFYGVLSDGSSESNRAAFFMIGSFMAVWIILYGAVQASAPRILGAATKDLEALIKDTRLWGSVLVFIPAGLAALAMAWPDPTPVFTATLVAGLLLFGVLFAVNSSLHSYLILAFSHGDRVTMDVGFYYMANAAGRLMGTVLSGLSYQIGGVPLCLGLAGGLLVFNVVGVGKLKAEPVAAE